MTVKNNFLKGFICLSIVLYVVVWLSWSFYLFVQNSRSLYLLERHFSPHLSYPSYPSPEDWTVYAASKDFLSRSNEDRLIIAEGLFQKEKNLAEELYFDTENLHAWYLKTAVMSLSEAPIKQYSEFVSSGLRQPVSYREFPFPSRSIQIKQFFTASIFETAAIITVLLVFLILLIVLPLRWIIRGFKSTANS